MRATTEDGFNVVLDSDYPPQEVIGKFLKNLSFSIIVEGRLCLTFGEYHTIYQRMVYHACLADVKNPIEIEDGSNADLLCKKAHWACGEAASNLRGR